MRYTGSLEDGTKFVEHAEGNEHEFTIDEGVCKLTRDDVFSRGRHSLVDMLLLVSCVDQTCHPVHGLELLRCIGYLGTKFIFCFV